MFRETLVSSIIFLSTSSIVLAKPVPYVGGSVGVGGYSRVFGVNGVNANLFGGYGSTFGERQNFYLGGELNAEILHYSSYGTNYGIGASLIPGIMITKYTMIYGQCRVEFNVCTS